MTTEASPRARVESLEAAIEAMMFMTDEPISVLTFAEMTGSTPVEVTDALVGLAERARAEGRGIQLSETARGWKLVSNPSCHELLERFIVSWDTRRLSQAALEVLAIVAYAQPVTRQGIANVRGVSSDSALNSLLEKGLVREAGVADSPGNPVLYATSERFLDRMGATSIADLPPIERFAPDEEAVMLIRERLSATHEQPLSRADEGVDALSAAGLGSDWDEAVAPGEGSASLLDGALREALAANAGAVEKIDFDELEFEE